MQPVTIKTPDGAMAGTESYAVDPYNGKDAVANGGRLAPGDPSRRAFAYFMMGSARCVLRRWRRLCPYATSTRAHTHTRTHTRKRALSTYYFYNVFFRSRTHLVKW